jgi:hypothetical protein
MRRGTTGVHDALGDALVIEVGDLLTEMEVLHEGWPALAGLQRMIGVGQPQALGGSEKLACLFLDSHG